MHFLTTLSVHEIWKKVSIIYYYLLFVFAWTSWIDQNIVSYVITNLFLLKWSNHLETEIELTPETLCLSNILRTVVSAQHMISIPSKVSVPWNVAPCTLVEIYRLLRGAYCLHHHHHHHRHYDGVSKKLWSICKVLCDYTAPTGQKTVIFIFVVVRIWSHIVPRRPKRWLSSNTSQNAETATGTVGRRTENISTPMRLVIITFS
jgi:hypothetical protein